MHWWQMRNQLRGINYIQFRSFTSDIPEPHRNPKLPPTKLFIKNEWIDSVSGKTLKVINPTNGQVITEIQRAVKEDVDIAVQAAKEAFRLGSPWRTLDAAKRGQLINKFADLIERDSVYLASLETLECGKIYSATLRGDLPCAIKHLRCFAGFADKNNGNFVSIDGNCMAYTKHEPVGICGLITAWNFSLLTISMKLAPALATGCTMVLKPSQHSTLAALHLANLVKEAGFPPGVVNIIPGASDVGSAISKHPQIDKISFTGSSSVGKQIYRNGADNIKRLTLELGGKTPIIILADADVNKTVEHAHFAAFQNMGQCCCAGSRTFVHESIYEEFVEKSMARIKAKRTGDPFDKDIDHGPQTTEDQLTKVMRYINIGKNEGATLEIGGNQIDRPGFFVEPTLFTNVEDNMTIAREEIFGPVQQISPFKTIDEVIERTNDSDFGLAASVFSNNMDAVNTITQGLRTGSVWVNCYFIVAPQAPFGGFKISGIGREGGQYGLDAFSEAKSIYVNTPTKNS